MRSKLFLCCAVAIVAVVVVGSRTYRVDASVGPIPLNCNRACLENVVDQHIDVGDVLLKTAQGRGKYTHIFADPEFGQVAYMGTMMEAGQPFLLSLRLRIELGRITEIESVLFKPGGGGPNSIATMDKPYVPEEFRFKSIPPAQRPSRQELICIADAYFSGIQKNDGKGVNGTGTYPFANDCHRVENGAPTTNVPATAPAADGVGASALDCLAQFKLGYYFIVQNIHDRRYPVVDQERGIVWSHAIFDQGTVNAGTLSDGRPYTFNGFNRPSSILVTEAFLMENGKIRRVETVGPGVNYHLNSVWPGSLSGN